MSEEPRKNIRTLAGRYQYDVEADRIGHGGQAWVYGGYDKKLKCKVAVKAIKPECAQDPDSRRRLARETWAAASINHPGIASPRDFVEEESDVFIVYEFVEGVTLRERLKQPFSLHEVLEIGIQLAEALSVAHDQGIVHRDLKPENLMVVSRPGARVQVKILDFGLAKVLKVPTASPASSLSATDDFVGTASGVVVGTTPYMSPEQVQGTQVDMRTDVYALGLVLYEMVTGKNPFWGETKASTMANILTLDAPPIPDLNPKCQPDRSARELLGVLSSRSSGPSPAPQTEVDSSPEQMSRGLARALFALIQAGYLAMYTAAFCFPTRVEQFMALLHVPRSLAFMVVLSALCGTVVRLFFVAGTALDHQNLGVMFRRAFPAVLLLDALWAAAPLTLFHKLGYPALLMMAGLVWLPFAQRTLLSYAYDPRGGRISSAKHKLDVR
jgi:tRNA A-37 threonylcarbamoyl transferase component Bud32